MPGKVESSAPAFNGEQAQLERRATTALAIAIVGAFVFQPLGVLGGWLGWRVNRDRRRANLADSTKATVALIIGCLAGLYTLAAMVFILFALVINFFPPLAAAVNQAIATLSLP